jgi:hypothetical protein
MNARYLVATLLVMSAAMLGVLIPGGPIETRNFSEMSPLILAGFNTLLTILGLGSFVLAYFVLDRRKVTYMLSAFLGVEYFLVYSLDLLGIFPVSPDSMSHVLRWIEVAGVIASFPLISLSIQLALTLDNSIRTKKGPFRVEHIRQIFLIALVAIGIITFATHASMR